MSEENAANNQTDSTPNNEGAAENSGGNASEAILRLIEFQENEINNLRERVKAMEKVVFS